MKPISMLVLLLGVHLTGCVVGEVEPPPVAPSQLTVAASSGGAHLTWQDNSADEMHFMVMRMMHDGPTSGRMIELATLGENVAEFQDASVEPS